MRLPTSSYDQWRTNCDPEDEIDPEVYEAMTDEEKREHDLIEAMSPMARARYNDL